MSFDEQPDGDPHGECAAEIHRLESERNDYKARALSYEAANMEQGKLLNDVIKERDELLAALEKMIARFDRFEVPFTLAELRRQVAAIAKGSNSHG